MHRAITVLLSSLILVWGLALPSGAQVVTVNPTPPPCAGAHCLNPQHGARVEHHGAASITKAACPAGTAYDARKGTCHVLSN